uniref:(S)-ureidoglycine aminohydrolase cupin domain-containing protein n=1 Tax=Davidia involucrata TaxID=16924 RepID=A0A5B7AUN9_DAVIN
MASLSAAAAISGIKNPNRYNTQTITKHSLSLFPSSCPPTPAPRVRYCRRARRSLSLSTQGLVIRAAETMSTEKLGIKIHKNPPESKLTELGVRKWPKWGCPPSKFPWTYTSKETCYLLEGKVKVYPDGSKEAVEIGAGDFVVFPKGMSCTWDVSEAVDKHYNFD